MTWPSILFPLLLFMISHHVAESTITVIGQNISYNSLPATFGMTFEDGVDYEANLIVLEEEDIYFCEMRERRRRRLLRSMEDEERWREDRDGAAMRAPWWKSDDEEEEEDYEENDYEEDYEDYEEDDLSDLQPAVQEVDDTKLRSDDGQSSQTDPAARKDSDVPLALLVKRGRCSFESKARNVMSFNNNNLFHTAPSHPTQGRIRYLVIYDNLHPFDSKLVKMGREDSKSADDIDVGLLFTTSSSGLALLANLYNSSSSSNGLPVTLNSLTPASEQRSGRSPQSSSSSSSQSDTKWMRFLLGSLLLFLPVLRGMYLWYRAGGRIRVLRSENGDRWDFIVIRPHPRRFTGPGPAGDTNARHGQEPNQNDRKLTREEVMSLPEKRYDPEDRIMTTSTCCSVCLEEYEEGERLRMLLPCNHAFHTDCILPWLTERQGCCPMCKTAVKIEDDNEDENENEDEEMGVDSTHHNQNDQDGEIIFTDTNQHLNLDSSSATPDVTEEIATSHNPERETNNNHTSTRYQNEEAPLSHPPPPPPPVEYGAINSRDEENGMTPPTRYPDLDETIPPPLPSLDGYEIDDDSETSSNQLTSSIPTCSSSVVNEEVPLSHPPPPSPPAYGAIGNATSN